MTTRLAPPTPTRRPSARRLDRRDGLLHRQLADMLRAAIGGAELGIGEELPTEAQLAREHGVSLITVRRALRDLEQDGLIRKRPAKTAIVVAANPRLRAAASLNSLADIVANTADVQLDIASWRQERSARAESVFGLPRGTFCHCLRGVLRAAAGPVSVVIIYFPPRVGARLSRPDFDDVVVFRSVQRRLGIFYKGGRLTVRAAPADKRVAALLGCRPGAPLLINEFVYFGADQTPIELTIAHHRGDLHSVTYDLLPE